MVTLRVNIVALILAGLIAAMFVVILSNRMSYWDISYVAVPAYIVIRVYDAVAGLPAFKGKSKQENKPQKDGKK